MKRLNEYRLIDLVKSPELREKARAERMAWEAAHPEEVAEQKRREEAQAQWEMDQRRAGLLRRANAPARVQELLRWNPELSETPAVKTVRDFMRTPRTFLLLSGGAGTGKTMAAAEALQTRAGRFVHAVDACCVQLFTRDGERDLERWRKTDLLVMDDLGTEPMSDIWRAQFDRLVDARYDARLKTILTTNLSPEDFRNRYGMRVYDRLRGDEGKVFGCGNESLRGVR